MHVYVCVCACIHTCIHIVFMYRCMHLDSRYISLCSYIRQNVHTRTCASVYVHMQAHVHALHMRDPACAHEHTHAHAHAHAPARIMGLYFRCARTLSSCRSLMYKPQWGAQTKTRNT